MADRVDGIPGSRENPALRAAPGTNWYPGAVVLGGRDRSGHANVLEALSVEALVQAPRIHGRVSP